MFALAYRPQYTPPPFEPRAVRGIPQPAESIGHVALDAHNFSFMIASALYQQQDGSLQIYLTNLPENEVYLMCEVIDLDGRILYRSGLLRPGEYLAGFYPQTRPANEAIAVRVHIYALEPESFFSAGTITIGGTLLPS